MNSAQGLARDQLAVPLWCFHRFDLSVLTLSVRLHRARARLGLAHSPVWWGVLPVWPPGRISEIVLACELWSRFSSQLSAQGLRPFRTQKSNSCDMSPVTKQAKRLCSMQRVFSDCWKCVPQSGRCSYLSSVKPLMARRNCTCVWFKRNISSLPSHTVYFSTMESDRAPLKKQTGAPLNIWFTQALLIDGVYDSKESWKKPKTPLTANRYLFPHTRSWQVCRNTSFQPMQSDAVHPAVVLA